MNFKNIVKTIYNKIIGKYNQIELISANDIIIEKINDKQKLYDFTVNNNYTFSTHDGIFVYDTMSIFVPMSEIAQNEARTKMITAVRNDSLNDQNFQLGKEMLTGIFVLTNENLKNITPIKIKSYQELIDIHPGTIVEYYYKNKLIKNTAGRIVFNLQLPDYIDFIDQDISNKELNKLFSFIVAKSHDDYAHTLDKLMKLGFRYATIYPRSISLDMFTIPPQLMKLKEELAKETDVVKQQVILNTMNTEMMEHLKNNVPQLYQQIASGAARGSDQLRQVFIAKGLMSDNEGNILPVVTRSLAEGLSPNDYFNAASAARLGVISRTKLTSFGGYGFRKAIYCFGNVECDINNADCDTRRTLNIKLTKDLFSRLQGRYVQPDPAKRPTPISEDMIGHIINLRSPVFCNSLKICRTCYGDLIKQLNSRYCGIISSGSCLSLSEKIMKCSVGSVELSDKYIYNLSDIWDIITKDEFVTIDKDYDMDLISEHKKIDMKIKGKDDYVKVSSIERHKPSTEMILINTCSNHTLFTQINHPLYVKRYNSDGINVIKIVAEDIQIGDKLYVNNSYISNFNNNVKNDYSADYIANLLYDVNDIEKNDSHQKLLNTNLFNGYNLDNIRFKPEVFMNIDINWIIDFLDNIIKFHHKGPFFTKSYELASQINTWCNLIGYYCKIIGKDRNNILGLTLDTIFYIEVFPTIIPSKIYANITNGYDTVNSFSILSGYNSYVYDVKTETGEYMCGGVQNSNSFHTGGAINLKFPNIVDMLISHMDDSIKKDVEPLLIQKNMELYLSPNTEFAMIKINKKMYKDEYKIEHNENELILPLAYFDLLLNNINLRVTIEQPVRIPITEHIHIEEDEDTMVITFDKESELFRLEVRILQPKEVANSIDKYIGGKSPFFSQVDLVQKFDKLLSPMEKYDLVHLEVIVGNILRDRKNPTLPARLSANPDDYITFSVKALPAVAGSFLSGGLAFENFSRALSWGLTNETPMRDLSPLDTLVSGQSLVQDSKNSNKNTRSKR